jgi:hypothetical protein
MRCTTILTVALALALVPPATAGAAAGSGANRPTTLAVIGDTPYDDAQAAAFPTLVKRINADRNVRAVVHLGDIKSGQPCTDAFFASRVALYDTFADPFVFTPGDNDWTDCHRPQFGAFVPTERLASLRRIFYPKPNRALGGRPVLAVRPQSRDARFSKFVENVMWQRSRVVFSTLHVVGSNNDLVPWFVDTRVTPVAPEAPRHTALRTAEFDRRQAANLAWLDRTFAVARRDGARGVVIAMQANLWVKRLFSDEDVSGFDALVRRIATRARSFRGDVLLLQGDTHKYLVDRPLRTGSPENGVSTAAPNVTRIVVEGETAAEWLRLRVSPGAKKLFSWTRRPV